MTAGLLAVILALGHSGGDAHEGHDHGAAHEAGQEAFEPAMHHHPEGERNHGTEWFFNQPWAYREGWGPIARDSAILAAAACCVFLFSGRRSRGR
mgnify:CR=1 FL=1